MPRRNPFYPPPDSLPPAEVRITELHVEPWPDGRRLRVHVTLTPFQNNPDLEAVILTPEDQEVGRVSIIENAEDRFVFTMHIRTPQVAKNYHLTLSILYQDIGIVDERTISFETQENSGENEPSP
jgi:hypothetical protein